MHNIYRKLLAALCCIGLGWPAQMLAVAFESSTADAPKWFRLFTPNRENRTLTSAGTATYLSGAASFTYTDDQLWRVELRTDGTYNLVCRSGGVYIDPSRTQVIGINPAFYPVSTEPQTGWQIKAINGQNDLYIIVSGTKQLHQGGSGDDYRVISYGGGSNTSDPGCQFRFESCDLNTPVSIQSANAVQGFLTMAPGNTDRIVMRADLQVGGFQGSTSVSGMTIDLSGSTDAAADLACIKVYRSTSNLFYGTLKAQATLLDSVTVSGNTVQLQFSEPQNWKPAAPASSSQPTSNRRLRPTTRLTLPSRASSSPTASWTSTATPPERHASSSRTPCSSTPTTTVHTTGASRPCWYCATKRTTPSTAASSP